MHSPAKKIIVIIVSLTALLAPHLLFAAQVTVLPGSKAVIQTAEFQTDVTIDTNGESINVFSGKIVFPSDIVELKEIRSGNSIVNYWVEEPKNVNGEIAFAGMTPGGYNGNHGVIFSLIFTATAQGQGSIVVKDPLFLKNDGKGTSANINISNSILTVLAPDQRRNIVVPPITDTTPPELFAPEISRSPSILNNAWLLFFSAQDKGSGIGHYEIQEYQNGLFSFFAPWQIASSPYLLKDQSASSQLNVRAIDKSGNIRTVHVSPLHAPVWYLNIINWFVVIGILALIVTLKTVLWRKRGKISS